jgi:hypothetical protein
MVDKKLDFGVGDMVISDCNTEIECLVKILSLNIITQFFINHYLVFQEKLN